MGTGRPKIGDTIYHRIGKANQKEFEKLVKKYEKEEHKPHVYYVRPEFRHAVQKNVRFNYKSVVSGFYIDTQLPIYEEHYIDLKQGRVKLYDAEKKAWADLQPVLINKEALPPTDKDRIAALERELAKVRAQLAKRDAKSRAAGKTFKEKDIDKEVKTMGGTSGIAK